MKKVNEFRAYEVACWIGKFSFMTEVPVKACLSFWYFSEEENDPPLIGEFSFDYDVSEIDKKKDKLGQFPFELVRGANQLFELLQKQPVCFDLNGTTKTDYAYDGIFLKNGGEVPFP